MTNGQLDEILEVILLIHNQEITYRIMRDMEAKGEPGTAKRAAAIVRDILAEWPLESMRDRE
jgi:hypothetical protein